MMTIHIVVAIIAFAGAALLGFTVATLLSGRSDDAWAELKAQARRADERHVRQYQRAEEAEDALEGVIQLSPELSRLLGGAHDAEEIVREMDRLRVGKAHVDAAARLAEFRERTR